MIETALTGLADMLWGNFLLYALVGIGIFYTLNTGWIQVRTISLLRKGLFRSKHKEKNQDQDVNQEQNIAPDMVQNDEAVKTEKSGGFSSVQALCTAVASCVGSGNIVGVATAILAGGPGVLFWMWVAAFFGMATKFAEIVLGICYREKDENGEWTGGPMYYIAAGLHWKMGGTLAALLLFIQNAGATLIQSNTITQILNNAFHIPTWLAGCMLAVLIYGVIRGGLKRLVEVSQKIVPFMAAFYLLGGAIVLLMNVTKIPAMFQLIFQSAFSVQSGVGVLSGITMKQAMRYGVTRGLYSNEAGEGSAAVLHSTAEVDHPVRQGFYGIFEVFIDTILICSTTGFAIVITGAYETEGNAAMLAAHAFQSVIPGLQYLVYISLLLFAVTSIMSQWYFGHVSLKYLKMNTLTKIYKNMFPVLIILGSLGTVSMVWAIQDCALGLLVIPNLIGLIVLAPKVRKLTKEFLKKAI